MEPDSVQMTMVHHVLSAFPRVKKFVEIAERLCEPDRVVVFNGTAEAYAEICRLCQDKGAFIPLNPCLHPNSYLVRSSPRDVARTESRTFVCLAPDDDPYYPPELRNIGDNPAYRDLGFAWGAFQGEWDPNTGRERTSDEMRERLYQLFRGCMRGRTMFVIPFSMGPTDSPFTKLGIEISDSPYVVANMYIMTRTGNPVLEYLRQDARPFLPCWHSVGCPLNPGEKDVPWPCVTNENDKIIAHFNHVDTSRTGHGMGIHELGDYSVMSYGSGYGGNALLGKKCYALRIGSVMGRKENWHAEHMLISHVTNTTTDADGRKLIRHFHFTGAFPSACGKTNLAMLQVPSEFEGQWRVTTLGDDIAWLRVINGRLFALNPETGFFGVAPGTSYTSNPNAMDTMVQGNTIFTNCGVTLDGLIWWGEMTENPPPVLVDWKGHIIDTTNQTLTKERLKEIHKTAAGANARYTAPMSQCPCLDSQWNNSSGVPIDAILFGGRRSNTVPLVFKTYTWNHGVLAGACMRSETTAAAQDRPLGFLNYDPMAMRPFIGYNYGRYFEHWTQLGPQMDESNRPDIYVVNWFRRAGGVPGKAFLWPGYSQNFRVIRWVCEHAWARRHALPPPPSVETPIGLIPTKEFLLDPGNGRLSPQAPTSADTAALDECLSINKEEWLHECIAYKQFLDLFENTRPPVIMEELANLKARVEAAIAESQKN